MALLVKSRFGFYGFYLYKIYDNLYWSEEFLKFKEYFIYSAEFLSKLECWSITNLKLIAVTLLIPFYLWRTNTHTDSHSKGNAHSQYIMIYNVASVCSAVNSAQKVQVLSLSERNSENPCFEQRKLVAGNTANFRWRAFAWSIVLTLSFQVVERTYNSHS